MNTNSILLKMSTLITYKLSEKETKKIINYAVKIKMSDTQ